LMIWVKKVLKMIMMMICLKKMEVLM
jgi:hypothetical protein